MNSIPGEEKGTGGEKGETSTDKYKPWKLLQTQTNAVSMFGVYI